MKERKKKAPEFAGNFNEEQRRNIEAEIERASRRSGRSVNVDALLGEIEQYCRRYASLLKDPDLQKPFVAEEKLITKFCQQLAAEEDRLPPEWRLPPALQQHIAEIKRLHQQRIFRLGQAYTLRILGSKDTGARSASSKMLRLTISSATLATRSHHTLAGAKPPPDNQNARMAPLDAYCLILLGVWLRSLGGDYWAKGGQADAARFIAACTKPVEAETSTREGAIRKRLKRLEDSGAIVAREEGTAPANPRDGELWVDSSEDAGVRPAGHGQTKPN